MGERAGGQAGMQVFERGGVKQCKLESQKWCLLHSP